MEVLRHGLDLVVGDILVPVLEGVRLGHERLAGRGIGELGEVGIAKAVPFQRLWIGSGYGRKVTAGPDLVSNCHEPSRLS